ncbi:protein NINJA homolog 1-like [Typha angustifolia]|uniref:protein NINJA homolog 1-like n=1 Tax=Typha angustifolia TaxID=59011 RepID=UPI003C2F7D08
MNLFQTNAENQKQSGNLNSDPSSQPRGNFWTDSGKTSSPVEGGSNDAQSSHHRFTHPQIVDHVEAPGKCPYCCCHSKVKLSHVSTTTKDCLMGEYEDVAESEAEGLNSSLASQCEENAKQSDVHKATDIQCLKQWNSPVISTFPALSIVTVPYPVTVKVPSTSATSKETTFPPPCVMQLVSQCLLQLTTRERLMVQTINNRNFQLALRYSSDQLQLHTLEKNSFWKYGFAALACVIFLHPERPR